MCVGILVVQTKNEISWNKKWDIAAKKEWGLPFCAKLSVWILCIDYKIVKQIGWPRKVGSTITRIQLGLTCRQGWVFCVEHCYEQVWTVRFLLLHMVLKGVRLKFRCLFERPEMRRGIRGKAFLSIVPRLKTPFVPRRASGWFWTHQNHLDIGTSCILVVKMRFHQQKNEISSIKKWDLAAKKWGLPFCAKLRFWILRID